MFREGGFFPTPAALVRGRSGMDDLNVVEMLACIYHYLRVDWDDGAMRYIDFTTVPWNWTTNRVIDKESLAEMVARLEDAGWMVLFDLVEVRNPDEDIYKSRGVEVPILYHAKGVNVGVKGNEV